MAFIAKHSMQVLVLRKGSMIATESLKKKNLNFQIDSKIAKNEEIRILNTFVCFNLKYHT